MDSPSSDLWVKLDPEMTCRDRSLLEMYRWWESKKAGRRMPSRQDFNPADLVRHLPNIVLIDVFHDPLRLRYRLIGTRITQVMCRDSTGKFYDEIYGPELLASIYRSFEWMIETGKPLRTFGEAFYPDKNFYEYETLNLPLSADGETINMVLGGLVFHPKQSASPAGGATPPTT